MWKNKRLLWINKRLLPKINVYICFMKCLNCNSELIQIKGKREKIFCDSTCRSNYWQKSDRLEKEGFSVEEIVDKIKKSKGKSVKSIYKEKKEEKVKDIKDEILNINSSPTINKKPLTLSEQLELRIK